MEGHLPAWDLRTVATAANAMAAGVVEERSARLSKGAVSPAGQHKHTFLEVFFRKLDTGVLQSAWMGGAGIGLGMLALGLLRLGWVARRARPVGNRRLLERLESLASRFEISRSIALLETDHPGLLVTYGVVRPRIIIPSTAADWPDERIDAVLAHELAHVRRGDWAAQILAQIVRSWWWFNPFIWIAVRRLRHEAERACDDEVLRLGTPAPEYAAYLLEIARAAEFQRLPVTYLAPAMGRPSRLQQRVEAMLDRTLERGSGSTRSRLGIAIGLLAAATAIGTFGVSAQSLGQISGSVLDTTGAGLAEAVVALKRIEPMSREGTRLYAEVKADRSGRFKFIGVLPGHYILQVNAGGYVMKYTNVSLTGGEAPERNFALTQEGSEDTDLRQAPLELLGGVAEPSRAH